MPARRQECEHKHRQIVAYLDARGLDAVVLTRRCNFAWYTAGGLNHVLTAVDVGQASLIVSREGVLCITNTIEGPRIANEELADLGIEVRAAAWYDATQAARLWREALAGRRTVCDVLVPGLPPNVQPVDPTFNHLRRQMTEWEITRYRELARELAQGLEEACRATRPRTMEHELAGRISKAMAERGIRTPVVLVAADERVRHYRHPLPTSKYFDSYGLAACGGERGGLHVSCTRLFAWKPIPEDLQRRHEAVCRVDAAMIAATRPGKTLGEILALARTIYERIGFPDEWKLHHQGGVTGYQGREVKAVPHDATEVEPHQVFAWNPSITGTKSEDTVLVGADQTEILSETGQWPVGTYEAAGKTWKRCSIIAL